MVNIHSKQICTKVAALRLTRYKCHFCCCLTVGPANLQVIACAFVSWMQNFIFNKLRS